MEPSLLGARLYFVLTACGGGLLPGVLGAGRVLHAGADAVRRGEYCTPPNVSKCRIFAPRRV